MLLPEVSPLILVGRELLNTRPLLETITGLKDPLTLFLETLLHPVKLPPEILAFILVVRGLLHTMPLLQEELSMPLQGTEELSMPLVRDLLDTQPLPDIMVDLLDLPIMLLEASSHPVMLPQEELPLTLAGRDLLDTMPLEGLEELSTLFPDPSFHPIGLLLEV